MGNSGWQRVLDHLLSKVIPAARDYDRAEQELSEAFNLSSEPERWRVAGEHAKRRAAEVAVAIDGLPDRAAQHLRTTSDEIRKAVSLCCVINGTARAGSIERVCAVANAYKHVGPLWTKHPIKSEDDILCTGAGYSVDSVGIGKNGGVEVLTIERDGTLRKFLGDVPWAIAAWFNFLGQHGAELPKAEVHVCGVCVKAGDAA